MKLFSFPYIFFFSYFIFKIYDTKIHYDETLLSINVCIYWLQTIILIYYFSIFLFIILIIYRFK